MLSNSIEVKLVIRLGGVAVIKAQLSHFSRFVSPVKLLELKRIPDHSPSLFEGFSDLRSGLIFIDKIDLNKSSPNKLFKTFGAPPHTGRLS